MIVGESSDMEESNGERQAQLAQTWHQIRWKALKQQGYKLDQLLFTNNLNQT